jgi:hypothetical protein
LKILRFASLVVATSLLLVSGALHAQAQPAPASVDANRKALQQIFQDHWEDSLAHSPEFASTLGDKRYNDKLSDYSVKATIPWRANRPC